MKRGIIVVILLGCVAAITLGLLAVFLKPVATALPFVFAGAMIWGLALWIRELYREHKKNGQA